MGIIKNRLNVVTSGLQCYLDAANSMSFVPGNTTWNDLTNNGNSATLTNITYSGANNGFMSFNGTTSRIVPTLFTGYTQYTTSFWYQMRGNDGTGGFILSNDIASPSAVSRGLAISEGIITPAFGRIYYWDGVRTDMNFISSTTNWVHVTAAFNVTGSAITMYDNGVLANTFTVNNLATGFSMIGRLGNNNLPIYANMANFMFYNRLLSADEVLQNYNALKARFGLN